MIVEWVLPDDLSAARAAREHVARELGERNVSDDVVDDAVLIASELAANAVRHGRPPAVLGLQFLADRVRITVANHGDAPDPRILTVDPEAGHGRGLAMVEQMAHEVGWSREGDRLDVWAELPISSGPAT